MLILTENLLCRGIHAFASLGHHAEISQQDKIGMSIYMPDGDKHDH